MGSKARKQFVENKKDVGNLMEFHAESGGTGRGRRDKRLEVLNKSAIVLVTAIWEAYCEDLAEEALEHIVRHTTDASKLSKHIRKLVAKELETDADDLAVWGLSGKGWKKCLKDRFARMQEVRNRKFNTPKWKKIDELFEQSIGLANISQCWNWRGMSVVQARNKLDRFITLRGAIAHRGAAPSSCKKSQVDGYLNHVSRIVEEVDTRVSDFARTTSGKALR